MSDKIDIWHLRVLYLVLVLGVIFGRAPWPSALGLLIVSAYILADRYFHDSFHDDTTLAVSRMASDIAKLKTEHERLGLKSAFGGVK